jgi:hypothetical protein
MTQAEFEAAGGLEKLRSAEWRLTVGLYHIVIKSGEVIPFIPNAPQRRLLRKILKEGLTRHIIVKARQLGFSTLIELFIFDSCYFTPNTQASIIDLTEKDAKKKLAKIRIAYKYLPPELKSPLVKDNDSEIAFANGSVISAALTARGGTNQILHISELGPIAFEDPKRANRIRTGALPSVPDNGFCFIESTFMGGKGGLFYEMIETARTVPMAQKTVKDFHLTFAAWNEDPSYSLVGHMGRVPKKTHEILDKSQKEMRVVLTPGQRLWYQVTYETQKEDMFSEYPSTLEECYRSIIKGAIYAKLIVQLRNDGQIYDFKYDPRFPVYSSWDLGFADLLCVWYWQKRGNRFDVLEFESHTGKSAPAMAQYVRSKPWIVSGHFLPHDAQQHSKNDGKTYPQALKQAGLSNLFVVPRTPDVWRGINLLKDLLPRIQFNEAGCKDGIGALEAYHAKEAFNGAAVISEPVHDWASHGADALRTMAEADDAGLIKDCTAIERREPEGKPMKAIQAWEGYKL